MSPDFASYSTHIGAACAKQFRTFADLAEKLNMNLTELMRQRNGKVSPSKGLAKELNIDESFLLHHSLSLRGWI